jgi:hypothetical protein
MAEKLIEYKGDASQLVDLAGCKVVYKTVDEPYIGLEVAKRAFRQDRADQ